MRNERYQQYLENEERPSPSSKYTEQLAQDRSLSTLTKVGIVAGALGLAVLGLRSKPGQKLLSSFGKAISKSASKSGLEDDIARGYYRSREVYKVIQDEAIRRKVYDKLAEDGLDSLASGLKTAEIKHKGMSSLLNMGDEGLQKVIKEIGLTSTELKDEPVGRIIESIRDAAKLDPSDLKKVRSDFGLHRLREVEAYTKKYGEKSQGWFEKGILGALGLRRMTIGDVIDGSAEFKISDSDPIRSVVYGRGGDFRAKLVTPRRIAPDGSSKEWMQLKLEQLAARSLEGKNLSMGKGLYMTKSGQAVDLRGLWDFSDKILGVARNIEIPLVKLNPYKIFRVDEFRNAKAADMVEIFSEVNKNHLQMSISSAEKEWRISQTLIKYGDKLYSVHDLGGPAAHEGFRSVPGIRNVYSRMFTKMMDPKHAPSNWMDLGAKDQPNVFVKLWSKFVDDSKILNQPETIRDMYISGTSSKGKLETAHEIYTSWLAKNTKALDDRSYEAIKGLVSNIYGEEFDLSSSEGLLTALQKIVEGSSSTRQRASILYEDSLKGLWYQYQQDPYSFMDSLDRGRSESIRKLLHKEFFSKIDTNIELHDILKKSGIDAKGLDDLFASGGLGPIGAKSRKDAQALLYSYLIEKEGSDALGHSANDISFLFTSSSPTGQRFRALSDRVHDHLNPLLNIEGLGLSYPERTVYSKSSRLLIRNPIKPTEDPVGFVKQFFAGRNNPEYVTTLTAPLYWTGMRLNEMLGSFGIGLTNKSMGSVGQTYKNLLLKRYLPIVIGLEALRYLNYESEKLTGTSLEQHLSNIIANTQRDYASFRDKFGITESAKKWSEIHPGAIDMLRGMPGGIFLDPTVSREETDEWIESGDVEVRKGRWWSLGNTPFQGGRVEDHRPNYHRRVKAKPLMTSVLYGSEDEYWENHWLPTPRYPTAPIKHFVTDPYHYEEKHYEDRPYLVSGGFSELEEIPLVGPAVNAGASAILKPKVKMHEDIWQQLEEEEQLKNIEAHIQANQYHPDQWGPKAVKASQARKLIDPGKSPIVAVLDTGVDANHPELKGRVLTKYGYNAITGTRDTADYLGHGTHVAGIISGIDDPGPDFAGIYPSAQILPVKVLGDSGYGSLEGIAKGIRYAIDWRGPKGERVDVINMSLGGSQRTAYFSKLLQEARESGITVIAASGNENKRVSDPAYLADVLAVGAIDQDKKRAYFSNYGEELDLVAPGVDILSSVPVISRGLFSGPKVIDHDYASWSGTSMATPHVAAAAAILKAKHKDLTPDEIRYLMISTAEDLGPLGKDIMHGYGLINIEKAVRKSDQLSGENRSLLRNEAKKIALSIEQERLEQLSKLKKDAANAALAASKIVDQYGERYIDPREISHTAGITFKQAKDIIGIYGWMLDSATSKEDVVDYSNVIADSRAMTSQRRFFWDSGINGLGSVGIGQAGGDLNEVARRAIGKSEKWQQRFNPVPNKMPSWMPGEEYFINFKTGDPYILIPRGEERLPGGGYEALHNVPSARMQMRGSGVGKSVEDIMKYFLHVEEDIPSYIEDILEEGNKIHERIQKEWLKKGLAASVEGKIYNHNYDITGHYDAILKRGDTLEVTDIKSMSSKRFDEAIKAGRPYDEHKEQVNFYMKTLGIEKGSLYYVDRNDQRRTHWFHFDFDPDLYEHSMAKVQAARAQVNELIQSGQISRFELYDDFERYKILADVAPYSEQFKHYRKKVRANDSIRFQYGRDAEFKKIEKQVSETKKKLRLYPYMFKNATLQKEEVTITKFLSNDTFLTKEYPNNPIRMAGLSVRKEDKEAIAVIQQELAPGTKVTIGYTTDPNKKFSKDSLDSIRAVVYKADDSGSYKDGLRNINRELIQKGYAREKEGDSSPAAIHARYTGSEIAKGKRWEKFSHMDTFIHTKFLQIRSPLESYKRRDLFGKDWQPWSFKDIFVPTLESWAAGNPLSTATSAFVIGALAYRPNRLKAGLIVGGFGLALSLLRLTNESIKGKKWIPKRRRKERAIDEYFDTIKYVKYKGLYEATRRRIQEEEGYDIEEDISKEEGFEKWKKSEIEKLKKEKKQLVLKGKSNYKNRIKAINEEIKKKSALKKEKRESSYLSDLAREYRDEYESTLYGVNPYGSRDKIYKALPKKDRLYFEHFVNADEKEREEIINLIPENQKRIYQALWGMKQDKKQTLTEFFSKHYLPHADWEGWKPDKNLDDIKVKVIKNEALDLTEFGFWKDDEKKAEFNNAPLININHANFNKKDLQRNLEDILKGKGLEDVVVELQPLSTFEYNVSIDLEKDRRAEIEEYIKENGLASII